MKPAATLAGMEGIEGNTGRVRPHGRWTARQSLRVGLAVLVLLGLALWVWSLQRGALVRVVAVKRQDIVQSVVATGRVNAPARMAISTEVAATVREVLVREGQAVRAGQVLVRLSDAEPRAAVLQARAALAEARSRALQQASVGATVAEQAQVQAQAAWLAAERDHERIRQLVAQGFFAPQRLDEARRALDTAKSALASAQVQAQANQPRGVEPQLAAARTAQAEANLGMAQARLSRLLLRAPVDAVVLRRDVEPGLMAQPGRELLALAQAGPLRIDTTIDERHLPLLQLGMPARAVADAFPGQPFDARLSEVAPGVDAERGSVAVRLALVQPPAFLKADMTVSVELFGGRRAQALVLPSQAVRDIDRAQPWVLLLEGGRARRVPVRLGLRGVGSVELTEGLAPGALVIPQTEKALPGDRVRAAPAHAEPGGYELPSFLR